MFIHFVPCIHESSTFPRCNSEKPAAGALLCRLSLVCFFKALLQIRKTLSPYLVACRLFWLFFSNVGISCPRARPPALPVYLHVRRRCLICLFSLGRMLFIQNGQPVPEGGRLLGESGTISILTENPVYLYTLAITRLPLLAITVS